MENNSILSSITIKKGVLAVLAVLTLFLFVSSLNEFKDYRGNPQSINTIMVSGKGEVNAIPDIATFNFSITEEGKTASEANKKATEKNNGIIAFLRSKGIEDKDIVATPSFNPKYEYSQKPCTQFSCPPSSAVIIGYEVSYFITVKVRKADDAGSIVSGLADKGAANLSGVSYTIDNDEDLKLEARTKAIEDAKTKAKKLAEDLSVDLGGIVSFSESQDQGYPAPMYMKGIQADMGMGGGAEMANPDLPKGQQKVVSNVSITFRID